MQPVPGDGVDRFQGRPDLVGDILIEDAGAFVEVLGDRDEAVDLAARIHAGIGVGFDRSFVA